MAEDAPTSMDPGVLPKPAVTNTVSEEPFDGKEEWKHRPPYALRSMKEFGEVKWRGSCQCGQVTYMLNRDKPLAAKFCHCRGCQVMHGAPFQWAAIFHKEDMMFKNGSRGLSFYASGEKSRDYQTPTKVSCAWCRTPIMDEGRKVVLIFPELIDFGHTDEEQRERREVFEVNCHIFYSKRIVEIPDGKPKWSGLDNESELLDDAGHKL
ncbi:Mss4-like protein [Paecilomyces variotii]|uniref:Mss4-like protein n=1 Tax=Byssochlamys spectabilis TaxID=264951 RepID=A0A443HJI8_BYSSP|nr:Mss4-like protein [Paecilomyces variotii]KAJ9248525.1 hypothetical protein DTO207G8_7304 [Paecilomyces variotii]KAJ9256236.1 hypothetical protein DTO195F2_5961 [Paecilomyces variotii]KAJ9361186.1 hypothetical protein DTO280E4_3933 [Paecilomyces variotii]KAJ9379658.1 hypothetical protein DTO063F5_7029 [Paecilomyces variotii]RWQ91916.1 Mss4-like protein [Paecilomyces variotii]